MKKILTFILAALMTVSFATSAFASAVENPVNGSIYAIQDSGKAEGDSDSKVTSLGTGFYVSQKDIDPDADDILTLSAAYDDKGLQYVQPGWTVYFPLKTGAVGAAFDDTDGSNAVTLSDAVKSIKTKATYQTGGQYIESIKIEYKKYNEDISNYGYFVAIKTKAFEGTAPQDVGFELEISKSSGEDKDKASLRFDLRYRIAFRIRVAEQKFGYLYKNAYQIKPSDENADKYTDDIQTLEFPETNGVTYEVSLFGMGRTIVAMDLGFDKDMIAKYPEANMDFYNGNGARFNRDGVLSIPAKSGSFIYGRDAEGNPVAIDPSLVTYDDGAEAFEVTTKTLGRYIVSDKELDLTLATAPTEPVAEAPAETPVAETPIKEVPKTGAIA